MITLHTKNLTLTKSILPMQQVVYSDMLFFKFELCSKPLRPTEVLDCFKEFTTSVIQAIEELHNANVAHLDIRLDNICFKDNSAVLIDFDRSASLKECADFLQSEWGSSSAMYKVPRNWTNEMVDWRQLGIMLLAILNETDEEHYHEEPTDFKHNFFRKLVEEG